MKKPPQELLDLASLGLIQSVEVEYRMTGIDTADTIVFLNGVEFHADIIHRFMTWSLSYNSPCRIMESWQSILDRWKDYEKKNEKELQEYERLKKKFEA